MLRTNHTRQITAVITIIVLCLISYSYYTLCLKKPYKDLNIKWKKLPAQPEEALCLNFIKASLSGKTGIFTNFLYDDKINETATGHQILSESEGLIMLYAVLGGNKDLFDEHFNIVRGMVLDNGVIAWRMGAKGEMLTKSSASIDDLRIIRALIYADDRWGDRKYNCFANKLVRRAKKYELAKDRLVDFYDGESKIKANTITISYIDLYTMKILAQKDDAWENAFKKGLNIINNAFVSENVPFFRKSYNYKTKSYSSENKINMIDYLNTLLHLSEVDLCPQAAVKWLKSQMKIGNALFNEYYISSAMPASSLESPASYAIACRIAVNIEDEELYKLMKEKLLMFQVTDASSPIYGAFGDAKTLEVYSFDNLQALLALQGVGGAK